MLFNENGLNAFIFACFIHSDYDVVKLMNPLIYQINLKKLIFLEVMMSEAENIRQRHCMLLRNLKIS